PAHVVGLDLVGAEQVSGPDEDAVGLRLDPGDVAGPPVETGAVEAEPAALTDGEAVGPPVPADDLAGALVDDLALLLAEALGEPAAGVAVGDEADVVAVRLLGHGEAALGRLDADVGLRRVPEGEEGPRELVLVEHPEDVGLVLGRVDGAVQLATTGPVDDLRVVPGRAGVEAERQRLVEERGELDLLVAAQARAGGAPGLVLREALV